MRRITRILIVDDHPITREGLRARILTEPDLEVCGEAASVAEAFQQVEATNPDLAIVDIQLFMSHGLDLIKKIKAHFPHVKMLAISGYEESFYAERSLRAGAMGYINKRECQRMILDAIRTVRDGRRFLSAELTQQLLGLALSGREPTKVDPVERLSDRELEVFQLIGHGMTTGEIAKQLNLSVHTIDTYREKLRHKLGLKNSGELRQRAILWVLENR